MKKVNLLFACLLVTIIFISNCTKPETWEMSQWYVQISRYKDDEIRAFALWCKTMEEENIQKICDFYFDKYAEEDRYLQIDFYDNRSFTPDYTRKINPTEFQVEHMIAQFYYNPFKERKTLEMLK